MESVGEFFKHVRETKGLTLDEVASKTRIRADFLKALEEGNFAKLPDQVFAKGFVRTYARSLGLDEEDAMHRFIQSAGAFYDKQEERERLRVKQAEDERRRRANRKALTLAVGVALLLLVLLLTREQSGIILTGPAPEPPPLDLHSPLPAESPPLAPAVEQETPSAVAQAVPEGRAQVEGADAETVGEMQGSAAPESSAIETSSIETTVPGDAPGVVSIPNELIVAHEGTPPLVLDLEALELTWVVVQIDGGSPHEALLRPGERVTWEGWEQFTLTLGNAGGVRVELNGEEKGPFGPSGSVARDIIFTQEG